MFFLQGAKGFYDLLLISALFFCFFIRRSKTADLVWNLVYIILVMYEHTKFQDSLTYGQKHTLYIPKPLGLFTIFLHVQGPND